MNNKQPNYCRIYDELSREAASWRSVWKELGAYLAPTRGFFDGEQPNRGQKIDHRKLIDSDPLLAVEVLCAGMISGLTSPSRSWFELEISPAAARQLPGAKEWTHAVKKHLEEAFASSNIYAALHGFYQEIAVFGTAAMLLEEDLQDVLRCRLFTAGEYVLGADGDGRINSFGREFFLTAGQMADKFGLSRLPAAVAQAVKEGRQSTWHKVRHLIVPNPRHNARYKDALHMPYRSVYFTPQGHVLKEGGYWEFPVIAARWEVKNTSDVYGKGPGWKCLGDVKMLQKMQKNKLVALDKNTNPPMMVSSGVQGEVNLLPGGLTRYSGTTDAAVKPAYQVQVDLAALENSIEKVKNTIKSQFFADVFVMLSAQNYSNMTAAEVAERHQEKLLVLGPVLERLKNELLDPLVERSCGILLRRGALPNPPQSVQGLEIGVSYVSMIAQAQKAAGMAAVSQAMAYAGSLAQAKPEVLDRVDFDSALEQGLEMLGVPPGILRTREQTQALRQARARQTDATTPSTPAV